MTKLIIAAVILIVIMLVFIFILFKNIIKKMDENAKKYFVNKMQDYDYILEEKQAKLEEIKEEIEKTMKYPGTVKITVVREIRAQEEAR